jgi:hypothetical protein
MGALSMPQQKHMHFKCRDEKLPEQPNHKIRRCRTVSPALVTWFQNTSFLDVRLYHAPLDNSRRKSKGGFLQNQLAFWTQFGLKQPENNVRAIF